MRRILLFVCVGWLAFVAALLIHDGLPGLWQMAVQLLVRQPVLPKSLPFKEYTEAVWAEMTAARAATKVDDHARAAAHYTAALALEPGPNSASVGLHIRRGNAYNALGDAGNAFADFDVAIRTGHPTIPLGDDGIRAYMGRGYALLQLRNYGRAKADFDAVLEKLPNDVPRSSSTLAWRGAAYQGLGDRARAVKDYKAALALDPSNGRAKQELQALGER